MKIEKISVNKIKPAAYNPRIALKSGMPEYEKLKRSIEEFGFVDPLIWNKRTGNLVGGHQRLQVLLDKGVKEVECSVVDLDDKKERALNIALNKVSGEFDFPKLKELLVELDDGDFDLELTGFSENELKELIDWEGQAGKSDPNEIPEPPKKAITKPGDLWILGDHRLLCGDSTNSDDVNRVMNGKKSTVIFTDPPYGVSIGKKNKMLNSFQKAGRNLTSLEMDDMSPKELGDMLLKAFSLWRGFMANDCSVFVCSPQGGGLGMMMMMMMMMQQSGLEVRHILNWVKNSPTFSMGRLDYDYQHEPILFTWTKTHKRKKEGAFQTSLWAVNKPMANKEHPTMKPVELPECAILNHSDAGDIIGDPFLGSGTTIIAAEKTKRKCYGIEIEPRFCDVIISRWEKFSGKKAKIIK